MMDQVCLVLGLAGALLLSGAARASEAGAPAFTWDPRASVEYLLKHQKEDGTWETGMQVNPDTGLGVAVGTAALASMALLECWDVAPERIGPAVGKGIDACLAGVWRKAEGVQDFETIAWGQLYTIQLLGRACARPEFAGTAAAWRKEQAEILDWLLKRQGRGGWWGYSGSFHTAGTLVGLLEARAGGLAVPEEPLKKAGAFLAGLRQGHSYRYSAGVRPAQQKELGEPRRFEDSAGRLGACALALLSQGRLTQEEFDGDLAAFIDHRDFLWKTREGVKSGEWPRFGGASPYPYFAFFGFYYGALALERASPDMRTGWSERLRADLLERMESDGTWINLDVVLEATEDGKRNGMRDNTDPGRRIYATAMSMMALKLLSREHSASRPSPVPDSDPERAVQ